jgi:hypothetical protein
LNNAKGGIITKHGDRFQYRLYGQPEAQDGEVLFELPPCVEEGIDWVAWPVTGEARTAYDAFKADRRNGVSVQRMKLKQ